VTKSCNSTSDTANHSSSARKLSTRQIAAKAKTIGHLSSAWEVAGGAAWLLAFRSKQSSTVCAQIDSLDHVHVEEHTVETDTMFDSM